MKQYLWVVDLVCAVVGGSLLVASWHMGYLRLVNMWDMWQNWLVYIAMVLVPLVRRVSTGKSTIVGEAVSRCFAAARAIISDRKRLTALLLFGFLVVGAIGTSLSSFAPVVHLSGETPRRTRVSHNERIPDNGARGALVNIPPPRATHCFP
jgi:hypothetical protein